MAENVDGVCRVCGNFDAQLLPIFKGDGLEHNLAHKIRKHLFPVNEDDVLPTKICYQCVSMLISWNDLYELSMRVNKDFKTKLRKSNRNTQNPKNNSKTAEIIVDFHYRDDMKEATLDPEKTIQMFNEIEDFDSFLNESSSSDDESVVELSPDQKTEEIVAIKEEEQQEDVKLETNNEVEVICVSNDLSETTMKEPIIIEKDISPPKPKRRQYRKRNIPGVTDCVCVMCGKIFCSKETLKIHIKTIHSDERPFICQSCGTSFKRKDHLDSHIKCIHEDSPHRKTRKRIRRESLCVHCGKILSTSHLLREHVNSYHSNNMPYKCLQCDVSFSRYSGLYHHRVKRNHRASAFKKACEHCGLEFENEIFYIRHKWKHEENLKCDLCNIEFENSESFRSHIEIAHEETKLLQCDTCGKKFGTKTSLQCHVKCHSDDKPFECQYCSWKFHKKSQLVVHIYRHTGERPYVCSICDKGFKQKGDMRKHKASHLKAMKNVS